MQPDSFVFSENTENIDGIGMHHNKQSLSRIHHCSMQKVSTFNPLSL